MNIFVYGTLTIPEIARAVLGRSPVTEEATLEDFQRLEVSKPDRSAKGPAIKRSRGALVKGRLLRDLTGDEVGVLDEFEMRDGEYIRSEGGVVTNTGWVGAEFYEASENLVPFLGVRDWSETRFIKEHLDGYLRDRIPIFLRSLKTRVWQSRQERKQQD